MAASKSSTLLVVRREGDSLVVLPEASPLLQQLPTEASVRKEGTAAVAGFSAPGGLPTARADFSLGQLHASRFLALGRTSLWWITPAWGESSTQVPEETQFLLLELESRGGTDGSTESSTSSAGSPTYALLLPLIDAGAFRATLRPGSAKDGSISLVLRIESGAADVVAASWQSALLVDAGRDPFELIDRAVATAARLSGTAKPREKKETPASVHSFGYCTWDSFYSKVSAAGVQEGLNSLVAGGAPPRLLILDDGWQRTDVDPQYRQEAAAGCVHASSSSLCMSSAVHEVEEAVASLLSGPDNHMDTTLQAIHKIQREDAAGGSSSGGVASQQAAASRAIAASGSSGGGSSSSGSGGSLVDLVAAWARAAYRGLAGVLAHLEASFFNACRQILEATPADHWRMRLFSTLATSRLLRPSLLAVYASTSDHTRRLVSVRANAKFSSPSAGPEHGLDSVGDDLASVVADWKARYGLRHVYCWHAMAGFWGGLGLQDPEMASYQPRLVLPTPTPGMLSVDPAVAWVQPVLSGVGLPTDPRALHEDMHAYLASCGVDGVKVDVQSTIGLLGSGAGQGGGPALAAAYHASLEASVRRYFPGNQLINCMCHSTEDVYRMEHTNLARVSDDFYPTRPASHEAHIANCAYNTLWFGVLTIPDWDMFHSQHAKALLHATARAVSGGPVYVSDRPGRHDFELLRRLVLPDGSVLCCHLPGRPTADCLFTDVSRDGTTALKVWNMNACTAVVAVFNIQGSAWDRPLRRFHTHDPSPPALTATVSPADVPGLLGVDGAGDGELFAAYCDSTQELVLLEAGEGLDVSVAGGGGSDVVTLSPVAQAGGVMWAPIGLTGMLNAGGAVLSAAITGGHSDDGYEVQPARAALALRGSGTMLCYASHRPISVSLSGREVAFQYDAAQAALRFELPAGGPGPPSEQDGAATAAAASASVGCVIQF